MHAGLLVDLSVLWRIVRKYKN